MNDEEKKCELARKWVIFGDKNARIACHRQFVCVKKNVDQKGPSEAGEER